MSIEHKLRSNLTDYKDKIRINGNVIPDPFSLKVGWLEEVGGKQKKFVSHSLHQRHCRVHERVQARIATC
ncbi:hypothetical protein LSAT2_031891 [Lamellibrachia satsuma]|nr:hypothetical protein LSAT2_031891 [Lamellibrachia satsuma]